jgi:photosystem II stability/assembly factor-like uncharacterized protein
MLPVKLNALLLFTLLLVAAASACNVPSTKARPETIATAGAKHRPVIASVLEPALTIIDHVQLIDRHRWLIADSNHLWRTENGGRTWALSYGVTPDVPWGQHLRGLSFINDKSGFLIIDQQVLRTGDGGSSWDEVGRLNFDAESCYFVDDSYGWAAGRTWSDDFAAKPKPAPQYVGAIFNTKDGGRTWQQQPTHLPQGYFQKGTRWYLSEVFFSDRQHGCAVGFEVIFCTTDGGDNWHMASGMEGQYKRVRFLDQQFGWATEREGNRVSITNDGGKNWKLGKGPSTYGAWATNAVFLTPEHGYSTLVRLYETRDGGGSWERRAGSAKIGKGYDYLGQARDGTLVALTLNEGTLTALTSTDKGKTWEPNK